MVHPAVLRSGIRIASLDAWRGLAALMVLALHAAVVAPHPEFRDAVLYRYVALGNYGVHIFFVVSGLCVAQAALRALDKPAPLAAFVAARIRRIYPPYLVVSALAVALSALGAWLVARNMLPSSSMGAERLFTRPPLDYACSALLLQRVCHVRPFLPVFWTLCYEAAFYALVAGALCAAVSLRRDRLVLDLCHGLTIGCSVALLAMPAVVPYPFDLWPAFGFGVIVLDILTLGRRLAYGVLLATVALQSAYAWDHFGGGVDYGPVVGAGVVASIAFALFLIAINPVDATVARSPPVRLLACVGVFSYSLYVLHWPVIAVVEQVARALHMTSTGACWLAETAAAIVAARVFYGIVERPSLTRRRMRIDLEATATLTARRFTWRRSA